MRSLLFLRKHFAIILVALCMGILSSAPQYFSMHSVPGFQGIYNQSSDDVNYYRARTKDVLDGHPFLVNPYIVEHKNGSSVQFWVPDVILALPIGILGLSVPEGFIVWNLFLIPLLLLLTYAIFFLLTRSRAWSFLGASFLNVSLFSFDFLRLPSPGLNLVFWLSAFLFILLYIQTKKSRYAVLASIFFGTLFNIYPYYWTFFVVLFGAFGLLVFVLRLKDISYKKIVLIFCGGLPLGLPYFISVWKSLSLPEYTETLARTGVIHTHFPSGLTSVVLLSMLILVMLVSYRKRIIALDAVSLFLFSSLLSGIIAVNQHLITGSNLEFSSHYLIGNIFCAGFASAYFLSRWLKAYPAWVGKSTLAFTSIIFIATAFGSVRHLLDAETSHSEYDAYIQQYAPVFDWLNANAKPDQVVFANDGIESLVPIYTSQNVYFSPYALIFMMPSSETEKRFIINHYFENFTDEYILAKYRSIFGTFYLNNYSHNLSKNKLRRLFGIPEVAYKDVPIEEVARVRVLAEGLKQQKFESLLKTYRVDYIIWDKNKNPSWGIDKLSFLKPEYEYSGIQVYSFR